MILRLILAAVCCLALGLPARACLNEYGTDVQGHAIEMYGDSYSVLRSLRGVELDREAWERKEFVRREGLETAGFHRRSDYAVALIYLGRYEEAIEILEAVEAEHPGEAIVATNLGTAYELNGDLQKALQWIQTGYERDPKDHSGSEWLHVKILEARIALAADPTYLKTHSVLGFNLGTAGSPRPQTPTITDFLGMQHDRAQMKSAIEYQLHERLQFVQSPDPVVADLLFDLGNLVALEETVEQALPFLTFAQEFGVQNASLLNRRMQHFKSLIAANPDSTSRDVPLAVTTEVAGILLLPVLGVIVLFSLLAIIRYRRSMKRRVGEHV